MSEQTVTPKAEGGNPPAQPQPAVDNKTTCRICGKKVNPAGLPRHEWTHIPDLFEKIGELEQKLNELKQPAPQPAPAVPSTETKPAVPTTYKVKDVKPLLETVLEHVKSCPECRRELGEWLTVNSKQFAEWFVPEEQRKRLRL